MRVVGWFEHDDSFWVGGYDDAGDELDAGDFVTVGGAGAAVVSRHVSCLPAHECFG